MKIFAIFVFSFLLWGGVRIYKAIVFNIEIGGHLKRAADANTVNLAEKEMEIALRQIEASRLTSGYTSVLYKTPDEDVGFWYQNLSASLSELRAIKGESTQLERSNVLMKLRETLLDQGKEGLSVTVPEGISIFPNNAQYLLWHWISFLLSCLFFPWRDFS